MHQQHMPYTSPTKQLSNFFFGLLFYQHFVLFAANVPETLLVFVQVDQRFYTLSTVPKDRIINTRTNGC